MALLKKRHSVDFVICSFLALGPLLLSRDPAKLFQSILAGVPSFSYAIVTGPIMPDGLKAAFAL